jgi:hypothetical protein
MELPGIDNNATACFYIQLNETELPALSPRREIRACGKRLKRTDALMVDGKIKMDEHSNQARMKNG